jgi:hypothetical protein
VPSRREFIGTLGATLGVLAGRRAAASAPGGPRRGESSTLNVSTDMRAFGFPNMTPNTPGLDATPILNEAIRLAGPDRFTTIVADPGTYEFWLNKELGTYVTMSDVHGLTIDLQDSSLIFRGTPGNATTQASALIATNCSQITLRNFSLDYDPLPFSQYVIQRPPGEGTLTVETQPGFSDLGVFASAIQAQNPPGNMQLVWAFVFRGGTRLYSTSRFTVTSVDPSTGIVALNDPNWPPHVHPLALVQAGDVLVIAVRTNLAALSFFTITDLKLQKVSIYSSGGPGVYSLSAKSSVFSGLIVVPSPGTSRLVSTNADGLTFEVAGANNHVVDSTFVSVQDDSLSVNSLMIGLIGKIEGGRRQVVVTPGDAPFSMVSQLSMALFVAPDTCETYGPFHVSPDRVTPDSVTLQLSAPLPNEVEENFLVCNGDPEHRGQGLHVARNRVLDSCFARGMSFWGLSGATIEGNYFHGTHWAAIDLLQKTADDDWAVAPNDKMLVRGNVLENCNQGTGFQYPEYFPDQQGAIAVFSLNASYRPARTPVNKDITVRDNYVVNTPGRGMFFQSIVTGSASNDLVQLASAASDANGNGSFTVTNIASDSANQIQVAPAGGTVGDPVVPGHDASATVVIPAGQPAKPPVGPLTFLMVDSGGARFTPTVMGTWPDFQFAVPAGAAPGAAALQISTPERPVARGGMFVASPAAHNAKPTTQ